MTLILAEFTAAEWIFGIIAAVLSGIVLAAVIATATHISNSEHHPSKKDIVFKNVCGSEMKGQRDCVEIELRNIKESISKLDNTVTAGFSAIAAQIAKLKG